MHIALDEARRKLEEAAKGGTDFASLMRRGSMRLLLFAPKGVDTQTPHRQDEVYIVVSGRGSFVRGRERYEFGPGDVLFAAAGEEHHFEDFGEDFVTWVVFYGVEGGEGDPAG